MRKPGYIIIVVLAIAGIIALLTIGARSSSDATQKKSPPGSLDLSNWNMDTDDVLDLDGEWEFYWNNFLDTDTSVGAKLQPNAFVKLPQFWNGMTLDSVKMKSRGYATYRLKVKLPEQAVGQILSLKSMPQSTAFELFVDGKLIANGGKTGKSKTTSTPLPVPVYGTFVAERQTIEVMIKVSNYDHRKGGIRHKVQLGTSLGVFKEIEKKNRNAWILIGVIGIVVLYHLIIYFYRVKSKMPLYFSLFCLNLFVRAGFTGQMVFVGPDTDIPYSAILFIKHATYFLSVPLALHYLYYLFHGHFSFKLVKSAYLIIIPFVFFSALAPTFISSHSIPFFNVVYLSSTAYIIVKLVLLTLKKVRYASLVLLGVFVMVLTAVNDLLFVNQIIYSVTLVHFGLIFLIFSQVVVISMIYSKAFKDNESLLLASNRFVPSEFLRKLKRSSLRDLKLGDQSELEMTVMFIDIRSFTTISESMKPEENFKFINSYLKRMGPIIRQHGGFIDKYIGDAIMALFDHPQHAIEAAENIAQELRTYNAQRELEGLPPINIGVGIHTGKLMLGIIGEEERLEGTVISDAVNLASRLEGVTKNYQSVAICSQDTLNRIENPSICNHRLLDRVRVKGKSKEVKIYELLDCLPEDDAEKRIKTAPIFQTAVELLWEDDYVSAYELFSEIAEQNPSDFAAARYTKYCKQFKMYAENV